MSAPFQVRPAQIGDRTRLLEVWERSVRATHHFLSDAEILALRPLVAEELERDNVDWWVLERATILIGFLGVVDHAIEALFIHPEYHRQGAGRFLVTHAQRLAPGILTVDVNEQNQSARKFYEALGFSVVRRSPTDAGGRPFPILHLERPPHDAEEFVHPFLPPG